MLEVKEKAQIIKKYQLHESDTGSSQSQIAILSERIRQLLNHLKKHPKDLHSKRGLVMMVVKRKTLLKYLKSKDEKQYQALISKIGLKK